MAGSAAKRMDRERSPSLQRAKTSCTDPEVSSYLRVTALGRRAAADDGHGEPGCGGVEAADEPHLLLWRPKNVTRTEVPEPTATVSVHPDDRVTDFTVSVLSSVWRSFTSPATPAAKVSLRFGPGAGTWEACFAPHANTAGVVGTLGAAYALTPQPQADRNEQCDPAQSRKQPEHLLPP